ncbi:hypothetical protein EV426DRAFT_360425 [Tirmania nivea]|nr:hypothetical protein EV426DRAFT_360425 [Tirmania nivea]
MAAQTAVGSSEVIGSEDWLRNFCDRFNDAAGDACLPPFFAAERPGSAPNPLIQVRSCKQSIAGETGSPPMAPPALNLSLPLPPSQLKDLRDQGMLVQDERVSGLEVIPRGSIAMLNGKAWSDWIQKASEIFVENNFRISETEVIFEFACVVTKENNGAQLGQLKENEVTTCDSHGAATKEKKNQRYKFAKLLVMLPTFEGFQLGAENPKSHVRLSTHQPPGDPTLAIWFHGALPTVEIETQAICLLYSVSIPLAGKDLHPARVLRITDEAAVLNRLRQLLQEWSTATTRGSISQLFLPCLLDEDYVSYDAITGRHAVLRDKLLMLAKELGLQFYCADFKREVKGRAQGWSEEGNTYHRTRYDSPERHQPDRDSNGKFVLDDDHNQSTSWSLSNLYDIFRNKVVQFGDVAYVGDKVYAYSRYATRKLAPEFNIAEGENLIIVGNLDFTTASLEFEEVYHDYHFGNLFHSWRRTALMLWHPDVHGQLIVKLCGWDAALLLTSRINPNGGGVDVPVEPGFGQMAIAENLVLESEKRNHTRRKATNDGARLYLLHFALETKRKDIFLATLATLPPSNPLERGLALLLKQGSDIFSGNFEGNLKSDEIFVTALGDYTKTVNWISFLRSLKKKGEDITVYLARVADAHTCNFHPNLTAQKTEGLRTGMHSYPHGRPLPVIPFTTPASALPGTLPAIISAAAYSPTLFALKFALECGDYQVIAILLKQIAQTIPLAPSGTSAASSNTGYGDFILLIYNVIASNAPSGFFTPKFPLAIQHFFLFMILKHLLPPLGIPPGSGEDRLPSLALPPATCRQDRCADCPLLSVFLTSSLQPVWHFSGGAGRRKHLAAQLNSMSYVNAQYVVVKHVAVRPGARTMQLEVRKVGLSWEDRKKQWDKQREDLEHKVGKLMEFFGAEVDAGMQEWRSLIKKALGPQGLGWDMELSIAAAHILIMPWPESAPVDRGQNDLNRNQSPTTAQATLPMPGDATRTKKRKIGAGDAENGEFLGAVKRRWNVIDLTESDTEEDATQPKTKP